ncbi:hypothetical protein HD554DRAFT_2087421 [Boletus coccyginus]|nr:hypothetical protein HD554DRAFT_2087421 [Boletus coccyginus]
MVAHLGEIEYAPFHRLRAALPTLPCSEDVYRVLRAALIERIHDKETPIRVLLAAAKDGEQTAIDVLIGTLSSHPAAGVRRAVLLNMPIAKHTMPAILACLRDTDTVVRRLIYSAVLEKNCATFDGAAIGPLHPRVLTIAQRELIIRNGLGDREPAVRSAVGSLLGRRRQGISQG